MAIAGNFLIRPDAYRERGYSGYIDWTPKPKMSLGFSSLITYRVLDSATLKPTWRQAHWRLRALGEALGTTGLQTEWDIPSSLRGTRHSRRASWVSPRGCRGAIRRAPDGNPGGVYRGHGHVPLSWGSWLSYAWFFLPQMDVRLDSIYQRIGSTAGPDTDIFTVLVQGHVAL